MTEWKNNEGIKTLDDIFFILKDTNISTGLEILVKPDQQKTNSRSDLITHTWSKKRIHGLFVRLHHMDSFVVI